MPVTGLRLPKESACIQTPAPAGAMVIFGASGHLATNKLLPAIAQLQQTKLLSPNFCLVGAGRKDLSDQAFRNLLEDLALKACSGSDLAQLEPLFARTFYVQGQYNDGDLYVRLEGLLRTLDSRYSLCRNVTYYLAVPPELYPVIVEGLAQAGLLCGSYQWDARCVIEKPFGRDLASARLLNEQLIRYLPESKIYRIDHFLGKETVQNIHVLRFANSIFEPVWNRHYIDHVQITISETVGVGNRGRYYDQAGTLRDMVQNHLLQLVALVGMEPPWAFEPEAIRDESVKVLRAVRPFDPNRLQDIVVRAQYGPGMIEGRQVCGYRQEQAVAPDSNTETFVAARLFIDNWRWKDVPFYVRTGKRLAARDTHVAIVFKPVPHSVFHPVGLGQIPPNVLLLRIQPGEGIILRFQAKRPGGKLCLGTLNMSFNYQQLTGQQLPDAYQRLLLDCMHADQTLFMRFDAVEQSWQLIEPLLTAFERQALPLHFYPAGSRTIPAADQLLQSDGRAWLELNQTDLPMATSPPG